MDLNGCMSMSYYHLLGLILLLLLGVSAVNPDDYEDGQAFLKEIRLLAKQGVGDKAIQFLEEKSKLKDVVTLPSGLRYKVLKKGTGWRNGHPKLHTQCAAHYSTNHIDGTEIESTFRGEPAEFSPNEAILAWREAMQMMVEGDKWELYVSSNLAYQDKGMPPFVLPNSALIFTLELVKIKGKETKVAVRCNPKTLEDCDDEMIEYIDDVVKNIGWDRDALALELEKLAKTQGECHSA